VQTANVAIQLAVAEVVLEDAEADKQALGHAMRVVTTIKTRIGEKIRVHHVEAEQSKNPPQLRQMHGKIENLLMAAMQCDIGRAPTGPVVLTARIRMC